MRPVRWSASLNGGDARGPNNFVAAASLRRRRTAKETRGMVCDGERVAAPPVAELELAFEVGAGGGPRHRTCLITVASRAT